ncbi:hypothetical protein K6Y31_10405 [Motilimonas cestriensis]|uniref:Dehydrogenase (DH) domain-containing protein n=1 Tax=Motilimonas cestriensis TaxID=2742685 RepID=A0ABS8W9S0_9GAMM|nr:hypothetical protein [Motilimonas cestriensis]MCE2595225.1 hypothetical protein [Motilimonas cestriensis]
MNSTLIDLSKLNISEGPDEFSADVWLDLRQHRYLYSHKINDQVVIPTVFLLEMALGVLSRTSLGQSLKQMPLNQQSLCWQNITAPRLAYLVGPTQQHLKVRWHRNTDNLTLSICYDKLNQQGLCIRPALIVLTAQLLLPSLISEHSKIETPHLALPTIEEITGAYLIPRQVIDDYKHQSPGKLGILFCTLEFRFYWQQQKDCLWAYSDISNSAQYCFSSEPDPLFVGPVLACMSAIQHLPFYGYLQGQVAIPANIDQLIYLPGWQDKENNQGKLISQITPSTKPHHVDILLMRQDNLHPVALLIGYQLQPRLSARSAA